MDLEKLLKSKRLCLWEGHRGGRHTVHLQWQVISKWSSEAVNNGQMWLIILQKSMDLQQSGVGANYMDGAVIGCKPKCCQNHLQGNMQKFTHCFPIPQLLQNSEHMSGQTSGQWIPQNSFNFPEISLLIWWHINICNILSRKKCLVDSSIIWRLNYFFIFTLKLVEGSH